MMNKKIEEYLISKSDEGYKEFMAPLIPTVEKSSIIGVRTPILRAFAKKLSDSDEAKVFMETLPHRFYEENNLHGFLIDLMRDPDEAYSALFDFLPFVDNWATCDSLSVKAITHDKTRLYENIKAWLCNDHVYTVRFGICMLMKNFLDEDYDDKFSEVVADVEREEYYINMAIAWYFATALAKQYDKILPYLENERLNPWVHNKTISKACDSIRINGERKAYLRSLRK